MKPTINGDIVGKHLKMGHTLYINGSKWPSYQDKYGKMMKTLRFWGYIPQ
jgi:hypothetical protein